MFVSICTHILDNFVLLYYGLECNEAGLQIWLPSGVVVDSGGPDRQRLEDGVEAGGCVIDSFICSR